jgi:phage gp36-like protein
MVMVELPAFASIEDLDLRQPGGINDTDRARAWAALTDASNLIRAESGSTWVDPNTNELLADVPGIVVTVCCAVALRVITNPDAIQQERLGSYSVTMAASLGDVSLTKTELRLVRKAAKVGPLWMLATTRDPDNIGLETPSVLRYGPGNEQVIDVDPPGEPIMWGGTV